MNNALKRVIEQLFDLCDSNGAAIVFHRCDRELLKKECIDFLSYLSALDGFISEYEAQFVAEYFGCNMSAADMRAYIDKNNTYSYKYERNIPRTLMIFENYDNLSYHNHGELAASSGEAFIEVLECLGKEFLVCDGRAAMKEVENLTAYISTLRQYKEKTDIFPKETKSAIDVSHVFPGRNIPKFNKTGKITESLDKLLDELNSLVGLEAVKNDVNSLIHLQEIKRLRKERGLKEIPVSNHLVFYGNPGTGKTTVARLLAKIYHAIGILSQGQLVEVDRSSLVAGYTGQTAIKVQDVVNKALGGVLFIDEAYALSYSSDENDYGQEAIDTLLKAMEDHREDFVVIVAGYPAEMAKFIDSNPGLRSRFNKYINFEDYNAYELQEIFKILCNDAGYLPTQEVLEYSASLFEKKYNNRGKNFANAREVRNFFEKVMTNQADRLFLVDNPSNEQLCTLELVDVECIS